MYIHPAIVDCFCYRVFCGSRVVVKGATCFDAGNAPPPHEKHRDVWYVHTARLLCYRMFCGSHVVLKGATFYDAGKSPPPPDEKQTSRRTGTMLLCCTVAIGLLSFVWLGVVKVVCSTRTAAC